MIAILLFLLAHVQGRSRRLQSVRLPIERDLGAAIARQYFIEAQIGTPAIAYKLLLSSRPTGGSGVFHCLDQFSQTFDANRSEDIVRFTQRSALSTRRTALRAAMWRLCGPAVADDNANTTITKVVRSEIARYCDGCDGVLNLRAESPVWRAFAAFTFTRNTLELHTESQRSADSSLIRCLPHSDLPSYCTFAARAGNRDVLVSLVVDTPAIVMPHWLTASTNGALKINVGESQSITIDLPRIEAAQRSLHAHSAFFDSPTEDDDDTRTASFAERAVGDVRSQIDDYVQRMAMHSNDDDIEHHIVLGSSILQQFAVRKHLLPIEAVEFLPIAVREHLTWFEALMQSFLFTHLVALVCHSLLLHAMYMVGAAASEIISNVDGVWWLETLSITTTLSAVVFTIVEISNEENRAALGKSLFWFIVIQSAANFIIFFPIASVSLLFLRPPRMRWRLIETAAAEQLVLLGLLTLSFIVRLESDGRTLTACVAVFLLIANCARNVYQAVGLLLNRRSDAWRSRYFRFFFVVHLIGMNLAYGIGQLTPSVLVVALQSVPLSLLIVAAAIAFGTYLVDAYRETEKVEFETGKTDETPTIAFARRAALDIEQRFASETALLQM